MTTLSSRGASTTKSVPFIRTVSPVLTFALHDMEVCRSTDPCNAIAHGSTVTYSSGENSPLHVDSRRHGTTPQISLDGDGATCEMNAGRFVGMNRSAKVIASLVRGSIKKEWKGVPSDLIRDNSSPTESSPRVSQLVVAIWDPLETQSVHGIRCELAGH